MTQYDNQYVNQGIHTETCKETRANLICQEKALAEVGCIFVGGRFQLLVSV